MSSSRDEGYELAIAGYTRRLRSDFPLEIRQEKRFNKIKSLVKTYLFKAAFSSLIVFIVR